MSSAWDLIRCRAEKKEAFKVIWNKCLMPSISFFLWRLLANRVPVDMKLQWRGVSLASKCRCCNKPNEESRLHLFVNGEAARRVWSHFAKWFPQAPEFAEEGVNIDAQIRWWQRYTRIRQTCHVCLIVPCLILWFIWTERNDCVHREKKFLVESVIKKVEFYLRKLVLSKLLGPEQWSDCCPGEEFQAVSFGRGRLRKVGRVMWKPPYPGWLKLNTDGAFQSSSRSAGGGGVLRNHLGDIVAAFAANVGADSGLEAEMAAILIGISLAKLHGDHIWLESDAELIVGWINSAQLGAGSARHTLAKIRAELRGISWKVSYIPREGNMAADFLANFGRGVSDTRIFNRGSVPARVKAFCSLDSLGMPSFRF